MIAGSVALAELRQMSLQTTGTAALQRGINISQLFDLFNNQVAVIATNSKFHLDLPEASLQAGWVGDWESAYDIAVRQVGVYASLVTAEADPTWSAVTGYYAAFFAARALLTALGRSSCQVQSQGVLPTGLMSLQRLPTSTSVGTVTVELSKTGSGSSHRKGWTALTSIIRPLFALRGLDTRTLLALRELVTLIDRPTSVSTYRNSVNYSLDVAASPVQPWTTLLEQVEDDADLQSLLIRTSTEQGSYDSS